VVPSLESVLASARVCCVAGDLVVVSTYNRISWCCACEWPRRTKSIPYVAACNRSSFRWVKHIQSPTQAPSFSNVFPYCKYSGCTVCRPPHPFRVGEYLVLQSSPAQVDILLGIVSTVTCGHKRQLHNHSTHPPGNTPTKYQV